MGQNVGMGSLADITIGDIGRALARYRPVAVTVIIILAVIAVLPGPRRAALNSLPTASAPAQSDAAEVSPAEPAVTDDTVPPVADTDSATTFDTGSSSFSSSSSSSSAATSGFTSDEDDSSASSSEFSSDFSSPSSSDGGSDDFSSSTSTTAPLRPLVVTAAGWSSTAGGTPLGSTGVPPGKLPVAKRLNQVEKYSYIRVDGEEKVLTLRRSADGARTTTGVVGVSVCQITDAGWAEGENVPSDRAPKYNAQVCVAGEPAADGSSWSFNLLTFTSPTDARGLALVPTGASIDYQVVLERS